MQNDQKLIILDFAASFGFPFYLKFFFFIFSLYVPQNVHIIYSFIIIHKYDHMDNYSLNFWLDHTPSSFPSSSKVNYINFLMVILLKFFCNISIFTNIWLYLCSLHSVAFFSLSTTPHRVPPSHLV